MSEHRTEVDGWQAVWRLHDQCIRIMLVCNLFKSELLMSAPSPTAAPDLVQMREWYPELARLWDAVRHQYWTESLSPREHPRGTI